MVRPRKNCIYVFLLSIPTITFMIGFINFHLDDQIVHAFQPSGYPTTLHSLQGDEARSIHLFEWSRDVKSTPEEDSARPPKKSVSNPGPKERYHVLINSYMNSGSRYTAGLFGFRSDAFYFYEPLWRLGLWDYFHRPNYVCSSILHLNNCPKKTAEEVNIYRERGRIFKAISNVSSFSNPIQMMTDILTKIYNCRFTGLDNLIVPGVQADYGGPGWQKFKRCWKGKTPKQTCIKQLEASCKSAKHVVTKVLRLTTDSLEELLQTNNHIKVIHLYRDPRAIENSRLDTKGYVTRDAISNARTLCTKMALDYQGGLRLMKKFPGRFKFVFYEDIKSNTKENIKILYDYVGMTFNESEFDILNKVKTNDAINRDIQKGVSRVRDNAGWWRSYIPFSKYKGIEGICENVKDTFNLTVFDSKKSLMDLTIPSMTLPGVFKIR